MRPRFISESIEPVPGAVDLAGMTAFEPGLPTQFTWRGQEFTVAEVLEKWKEVAQDTGGGRERYLRKHWFRVRTTGGDEMKIYFERQPASKSQAKKRWWLFTLTPPEAS